MHVPKQNGGEGKSHQPQPKKSIPFVLQRQGKNKGILDNLNAQMKEPPGSRPFVLQRQGQNAGIQAKLRVGKPNDRFEQEADHVADQVVEQSSSSEVSTSTAPPVQTMKVGPGDLAQRESDVQLQEEEEVQLQSESESESEVQMMDEDSLNTEMGTDESESVQLKSESEVQAKSDTDTPRTSSGDSMSTPQATPAPPVQLQAESSSDEELQMKEDEEMTEESDTVQLKSKSVDSGDDVSSQIQSAKGGGLPMEDSIKSEMESGFGHDFSNVRIHTGSGASNMNKSLGAKAFTTGNDIFFNEGEYQPNAKSGKQLLAHELTHTLQQGSRTELVQKQDDDTVADEEPELKVSIPITTDKSIEEGDPEFYAMNLLFAKAMGLDKDNYRVKRSYKSFYWENGISAKAKGSTFNVSLKNSTYIAALRNAYAEDGFDLALEEFFERFEEHDEPFTQWQRLMLRMGAEYYGMMTTTDAEFFDKWIHQKVSTVDNLKTTGVTFDSIFLHLTHLRSFLTDRTGKLKSIFRIATFSKKRNTEDISRMEYLKNRIIEIPDWLLKKLLDETGVSAGEAISSSWYMGILPPVLGGGPINTAKKIVEDEKSRLDKINEQFKERGFETSEVFEFITLFRQYAMGEAFTMLEENHSLLVSEHYRYTGWDAFKKLYYFIQSNYTPRFREADKVRAESAISLMKKYKSYRKAGGEIANTIYGLRQDIDAAAEYVGSIEPLQLVNSMAHIIRAHAMSQKTWKDHLDDAVDSFTDPYLMITGDRSFAEFFMRVLNEFSGFKYADELDRQTVKDLTTNHFEEFPVLSDISFDFRRMTSIPMGTFRKTLLEQLEEKRQNNEKIQSDIKKDPETVWKLELLIQKVQDDLGISSDSKPGRIIQDIHQDKADAEFWKNIALGALGIVLGVAGFFTGGATWAALALAVPGLVISGYVLYEEIERYQFEDAARDTSLDAATELSAKDPSMLGIVLAVVGLIFDVFAIGKVFKAMANGIKSAKALQEIAGSAFEVKHIKRLQKAFDDFLTDKKMMRNFDKHAKNIYTALGDAGRTSKMSLDEFTKSMRKVFNKQDELKRAAGKIYRANGISDEIGDTLSDGLIGVGTQRLLFENEEAYKRLVKAFAKKPELLVQFSVEATFNPTFAKSFTRMSAKLKNPTKFKNTMIYLHNNRGTVLTTIDDALDVLDRALISSEDLYSRIIQSPRLQKVMQGLDNPEDIKVIYTNYWKRNPASSFSEFAEVEMKIMNTGAFGKYSTSIDDAVKEVKKESLFGDSATTFLDSEYRTVKAIKEITAFRAFGDNAKLGGSFVTTSSSASRTELALLEEWNNSMRFEAKIKIPKDTKMNIGKVGPQTSKDGSQFLAGGGEQIILPYKWDTDWVIEIKDITTGKVYSSVDEFKVDFPDLVD